MSDDIFAKLDGVFDADRTRKEEANQQEQERAAREKAKFEQFRKIRDNVIVPAMHEMGAYLESKGYHYSVSVDQEGGVQGDAYAEFFFAPVGMSLYPLGNTSIPHLKVRLGRYSQQAYFIKSNILANRGGSAGGDGDISLDDINRTLILERLAKLVQEVVK